MNNWSAPGIAEGWKQTSAERNRYLAAATDAMFAQARVAPGMRVLELGTGAGDVAIMAAERVGARGSVIATDLSEQMVSAAAASVREAGATNVTIRQMDAEAIDLPEASFDAALARMVLMFVGDLRGTFAGVARVLVPGGRFAGTIWSALAKNPYHATILDVARESGTTLDASTELVRAFTLSDGSALVEAARAAGWADVDLIVVPCERRVASIAEQIDAQRKWPLVAKLFAHLDDAAKGRAWAEIERRWRKFELPDGGAAFPAEVLVFAATRGKSMIS